MYINKLYIWYFGVYSGVLLLQNSHFSDWWIQWLAKLGGPVAVKWHSWAPYETYNRGQNGIILTLNEYNLGKQARVSE